MNDFEYTLVLLHKAVRNGNCLEGKIYNGQRYPYVRIAGRKSVKANRLILKLWEQNDGGGLFALHTCDNTKCINPSHLYWGTQKQNIRDAVKRLRQSNIRKTHCKYGHAFSGDNLRIQKTGKSAGRRTCKACMNRFRKKAT